MSEDSFARALGFAALAVAVFALILTTCYPAHADTPLAGNATFVVTVPPTATQVDWQVAAVGPRHFEQRYTAEPQVAVTRDLGDSFTITARYHQAGHKGYWSGPSEVFVNVGPDIGNDGVWAARELNALRRAVRGRPVVEWITAARAAWMSRLCGVRWERGCQ